MLDATKLDEFTAAYIEAALWSSADDDGDYLDSRFDQFDLAPETLEKMIEDCRRFQAEFGHLFTEENCSYRGCPVAAYAGHDFWLNRNGHGCGFWDGDWEEPAASILDAASRKAGQVDLYVGDDGRIYL